MLKILCRRHFIKDLHGEEIIRAFHEKQLQKTNQKEFRTEKVIKRKDNKLNAKHTIIRLIAGLIKKTQSKYFLKPKSLAANLKVELDLSNYATKVDLKNVTGVDTLDFAKKTDLSNLESDLDKLDIDKFKNIPSNLSNLKSKVDKIDADKLVPIPVIKVN